MHVRTAVTIAILALTSLGAQETKSLRKLAEQQGRDILIIHSPGLPIVGGEGSEQTPIQRAACKAELVIIGRAIVAESRFNADETSILTRYEVKVERALKGSDVRGHILGVERPGGSIMLGQTNVTVGYEEFHGLDLDQLYLLFLRKDPNSHVYTAVDQYSAFRIKGAAVSKTTKSPDYPSVGKRWMLQDLLAEMEKGLEKCGSPRSRGKAR